MKKSFFSKIRCTGKLFMVVLLITGLIIVAPVNAKAKELKLVIASYLTPGYKDLFPPLKGFVDSVNKRGKGVVQLDFFHSGTLLKAKELMSGLQAGTADIIFHTDSYITGTYPILGMVQLPLVFKNAEERFEKMKSGTPISNYLIKKLDEKGLCMMGYAVPPMEYVWTTKKAVRSPSDLKGKRLRVSGKVESKTMVNLGVAPVRMPSAEAYMALKRGIVEGMMSYPGTIAARKLEGIIKYCTKASFGSYGVLLMTTSKRWESWPENVRRILREEAIRFEADFYKTVTGYSDYLFKESFKTIEIIELTEKENEVFKQALTETYDWWVDLVGKEVGQEALRIVRGQQ